jgi:hypothetical protein
MFHLFDRIRHVFQPSESKLRAMFQLGKIAGRQEVLKERIAFSGLADVPTIDLGEQPIHRESVPAIPGDRLHEWGQTHKPGYRPIRLLPAPAVQHTDFPWLPDDHSLNYDHSLNSHLSALHELLRCYAKTEVKLKAVKAPHERK